MTEISDLPIEIMLHIFRCYLETETQENLLKNVANVCLDWKNICQNSYLWTKFDGSLSFERMMILCKTGYLNNTKKVILSSSNDLNNVDEVELFTRVKNVEAIDFSNVKQLSKSTLSVVANNCTKLREVTIGGQSKNYTLLNYAMVDTFFAARGNGIVKIHLSYCCLTQFPLTIYCIADCCPNLEYLLLRHLRCRGEFPTKYFQMHCPKLKELHLDYRIRVTSNCHPSGFPHLEAFTYIDYRGDSIKVMTDQDLKHMLFNSLNLRILNLRNCDVSATLLCSLPACSVERLYISRSKVCDTIDLSDVLKKWNHSLKAVDISHATSCAVNKGILYLVTTPAQSPLQYLNISFTDIIAVVIEEILLNCTYLKILNLDGCENLGRKMKKTYCGKYEFAKLSAKIREFKSARSKLVGTSDIG